MYQKFTFKAVALLFSLSIGYTAHAQLAVFSTVAGSAARIDSVGNFSQYVGPAGIAFSSLGNLLIADQDGQQIRSLNITTTRTKLVSGSGFSFNLATNGIGKKSNTNFPQNIALGAGDSVAYFTNNGSGAGNNSFSTLSRVNLNTTKTDVLVGRQNAGAFNITGPGIGVPVTAANGVAVLNRGGSGNDTVFFATENLGIVRALAGSNSTTTLADTFLGRNGAFLHPSISASTISGMFVRGNYLYYFENTSPIRLIKVNVDNKFDISQVVTFPGNVRFATIANDSICYVNENNSRIVRVNYVAGIRSVFFNNNQFSFEGIAFANDSNCIYAVNGLNNTIVKIKLPGLTITTISGNADQIANGPAKTARLNGPQDISRGKNGNFYISDTRNGRIRVLNTNTNQVAALLGGGNGIDGDGNGVGSAAKLTAPTSLLLDSAMNTLYFTESSRNAAMRVKATNLLTNKTRTLGGTGNSQATPGWANGDSLTSKFTYPQGLVLDSNDTKLLVGDGNTSNNEGKGVVRAINIAQKVTSSFVGTFGVIGSGTNPPTFDSPGSLLRNDTVIYIADSRSNRILKYNTVTKRLRFFVGRSNTQNPSSDNAVGLQAFLRSPNAMCFDNLKQNIFFVEGAPSHRLRKVSLSGTNKVTTLGGGTAGYADGLGSAAQLFNPGGLTFDSTGNNLYIIDSYFGYVRKVTFVVNTAPGFTAGGNDTVLENAPTVVKVNWATNITPGTNPIEASQKLTFTLKATPSTLFSTQPTIDSLGTLKYKVAANANGIAIVSVKLKDNGGTDANGVDSAVTALFNIVVLPVNQAPVYTVSAANSVITRVQTAGAVSVTSWATLVAASNAPNNEGTQTLGFTLKTKNPGLYSVVPTATLVGAGPSYTATLAFTPNPTSAGSDTLTIVLRDNGGLANGGLDSVVGSFIIKIIPYVNSAPAFNLSAGNTNLTYPSTNTATVTITNWATAVNAGPVADAAQTLVFSVMSKRPTLYSVLPSVAIAGTTNKTGTLSFKLSGLAGKDTLVVKLKDNGGTANGGVDSLMRTFYITVNAVLNVAPSFTVSAANTVLGYNSSQINNITVTNWATAVSAGPAAEAAQTLVFTVKTKNPQYYATQPTVAIVGSGSTRTGTLSFRLNGSLGTDTLIAMLKDNGGILNGGTDTLSKTFYITIVTGLPNAVSYSSLNLYPNPSVGDVRLDMNGVTSNSLRIALIDNVGREVLVSQQPIYGNTLNYVINTSALPKGLYMVQISDGKGLITKKLVLQ